MKKTGAFLAKYALEQIGTRFTFGIPGVHNTELYDELNKSEQIHPVLVTHEASAAFMADAVSRTSSSIGVLAIVPAAGTTHAMSGIGEAYLDGIPMLVISGGIRRDTDRAYQLHELDQSTLVQAVVKKYYLIESHEQVVSTIYDAYETAVSGEPGPVFIELPVNLQLFSGKVEELPPYPGRTVQADPETEALSNAIEMLKKAKSPGIYAGWGATQASDLLVRIAEKLEAPVSTTLQGKSVFPADHPLYTGVGFGPSAVPAAEKAFNDVDCLLAVGARFGELATGSFGMEIPENLIHVDINPEVFNKNYPAKIAIEGDSATVLEKLLPGIEPRSENTRLRDEIARNTKDYYEEWLQKPLDDKVSPGHFFKALREKTQRDAIMVVDDGKHTFLASELYPVYESRHFISPTDFNCMGYSVPASIGAKMANPDKQVVTIVGDGAFMMTGLELVTANTYGSNVIIFVFHDGELGQISQFQKIPMNRKTCSVIGNIIVEGVAIAAGIEFISIQNDHEVQEKMDEALKKSESRAVLVDVNIDYSKKTRLTKGVVKTNLGRFPLNEKVRFLARAAKRHIFG